MAGIVRSILEVRLAFFYLGIEQCSKDEWDCRWNLFNLHDCTSRIYLFEEMDNTTEQLGGFRTQAEELRSRLHDNAYFQSLEVKRRNRFLSGNHAYLSSLEEIGVRAGVDLRTFRWLYRLLSSQVHGLPMSFYRMSENRGRGVHSGVEEDYTNLCLSLCLSLLVAARDEMTNLFAPLLASVADSPESE